LRNQFHLLTLKNNCPKSRFLSHWWNWLRILHITNKLRNPYKEKDQQSLLILVNLQDESPTIVFGPHIDDKEEFVAPFYVTLNIHDKMLHNCMLDSGASHNLMPKVVMENLGLEITRPYHDLYSFDARKVKCDGMIKDMVVTLAQLPVKIL
jgi:hypothetical protein